MTTRIDISAVASAVAHSHVKGSMTEDGAKAAFRKYDPKTRAALAVAAGMVHVDLVLGTRRAEKARCAEKTMAA